MSNNKEMFEAEQVTDVDRFWLTLGQETLKEYRQGFFDEFWMKDNQLGERFDESPFFRITTGFYEEQEYAEFYEDDPYGWADYAAELPEED